MQRRRFLRGSSALLVAAASGLSGCASLSDGSNETPTVATDRLETWLPDTRALDSELDHYRFSAVAPAALSEVVEADVFGSFDQDTAPQTPPDADVNVGTLPASDVDLTFEASMSVDPDRYGFKAYFGSFDSDWLETKLQNNDYDRIRAMEGFTLYEDGDNAGGNRVTAISEDVLIAGTHQTTEADVDADAIRIVETLIETGQGDATRYTEAVEDMSDLLSTLPAGHRFSGGTFPRDTETVPAEGKFTNLVADGETRRLEGSETTVTKVLVFVSDADVVERDIETYIEESGDFVDFSERPEYETDGRVVTIEGRRA